jgi:hypothetical protein
MRSPIVMFRTSFGVALSSDKGSTVTKQVTVLRSDAFLLLADEGPNFGAFGVAYIGVANFLGHDPFTLLVRGYRQLEDSRVMDASHGLNRRNAVAFD